MNARQRLDQRLAERAVRAEGGSTVRRYRLSRPGDAAELDALLSAHPDLTVHDTLDLQLAELLFTRAPGAPRDPAEDTARARAHQRAHGAEAYGEWVHFPWRRALCRVLPERDFVELRSARNQLHLTLEEQRRLRSATLGIVGLSVGGGIATTLALEGVGGRFRLADPDALELSNQNRLPHGVGALGVNKATLAARAMLEIDPYLDVEVRESGVRLPQCAHFFDEGPPLDLLIEECDDLPVKLGLREHARTRGVPVITETSQGGMLDVERFDLEPARTPFHGLLGADLDAGRLQGLCTRDKAPFVLRFFGGPGALSPRLAASLLEIDHSLTGWPQLGSAVMLGAALTCDAARRVLLGQLRTSGRFHVDLGRLVRDDTARLADARAEAPPCAPAAPCAAPSRLESEVARWVRWACLAPSGGNAQPWRFQAHADGTLDCALHPARSASRLDPDGLAARVACGAALVNLQLAAGLEGCRVETTFEPDPKRPDLLYRCRFVAAPDQPPDPLAAQVPRRCTNRRRVPHAPLPRESAEALHVEARAHGAALQLVETPEALARAGQVLGELERVRVLCPALHWEMMGELTDAPDARRGMTPDTLELDATDRAALSLLRRPDVVQVLREQAGGRALVDLVRDPVRESAALALLHVPGRAPQSYLRGGCALQRVWLRATVLGVAVQPLGAGLYLREQLRRDGARRLPAPTRAALETLAGAFDACFALPRDQTAVLILRLSVAPAPSARSGRLPTSEVLESGHGWDLSPDDAQRRIFRSSIIS